MGFTWVCVYRSLSTFLSDPDEKVFLCQQAVDKVRQLRSRIVQRLNVETNFGDRKHVRGFSVCQELLRRANGYTKCGPYLLASSVAVALLGGLSEQPG